MRLVKGLGFLVSLLIATLLVQNTAAVPVLFDFDDAPYLGVAADIEVYMENVYGSDITVEGGIVGNGRFHGPLGQDEGDDDHYIQAGPNHGTSWFSFSFNKLPITAVSFDWAVEANAFHAYTDDVEFFSSGWGWWGSGNSGTTCFDSPVTVLKFTNSDIWEIEIDNLIVTSLPEPATISLLGIGCALMTLTRKRRFV